MAKRIYDEIAAIRAIGKRSDVYVDSAMKTINISIDNTCGIKTWGKIDYLVNHCKYAIIKVQSISKDLIKKHIDNYSIKGVNNKTDKHTNKLNIQKSVKNIMKKVNI